MQHQWPVGHSGGTGVVRDSGTPGAAGTVTPAGGGSRPGPGHRDRTVPYPVCAADSARDTERRRPRGQAPLGHRESTGRPGTARSR
eukprot:276842-Hanusia_phi.AAC.1